MIKAVSLFSGGLDSILAIKIMESLGVKVFPLHIKHPFLPELDSRVKEELGFNITEVDISDEFLKILENPPNGYGKNLNPCLDCKILFYKTAKTYMERLKADFIITGDVVGQRPFSQRKEAMNLIERQAELKGYVVRPLTQKNLSPSIPEKKGLIEREKLYSINGRKRAVQYELAKKYNIKFIPTPAGGCLLTDKTFSERTKSLMESNLLTPLNIEIIKHGRLINIEENQFIIVGRNEEENNILQKLFKINKDKSAFIETLQPSGPSAIIIGIFNNKIDKELIEKSIKIIFKYMKDSSGLFLILHGDEEFKVRFDNK